MKQLLIFIFFTTNIQIFSQDCPDSCAYYIPNSLTPNCDAVGCELLEVISNCSFTKFDFRIHDRWGEVIFKSDDPKVKFDSSNYKTEVYFWILKGEYCNSKIVNDTGHITIIR